MRGESTKSELDIAPEREREVDGDELKNNLYQARARGSEQFVQFCVNF